MKNQKIKTIFIGTPEFGARAFEALIKATEFEFLAAITQPDKKVGRSQVLTQAPIKQLAGKYDIPVWQPASIADFHLPVSDLDLIVVIAYAQIIPENILKMPKYGCINVHGSLLPKYRGAACIQAPILNGDTSSGITFMLMDKGLDTGPIINQFAVEIKESETAVSLSKKLSRLAEQKIVTALLDYIGGKSKPAPQDDKQASYVKMLRKENGRIDWKLPAEKIERRIRAMKPWPGSFSSLPDQKKIIIHGTEKKFVKTAQHAPGTILEMDNRLIICASDQGLIVTEVQIEGKMPISSKSFLAGYKKYINAKLI